MNDVPITNEPVFIVNYYKSKSRVLINGGDIIIETPRTVPNWWCRFWYRTLLGWEWEAI